MTTESPMRRYHIDLATAPRALRRGLATVLAHYPRRFSAKAGPSTIHFQQRDDAEANLAVRQNRGIDIVYRRPCDAFRALGRLLALRRGEEVAFSETCPLTMAGVMFDVSRNGVLRPEVLQKLMVRLALMGLNMVILYTEDTYEVPGEPMFGYLRGRYTQAELRHLDKFAAELGIEMFPCIQALAHLAQVLQWPAYRQVMDTEQVLLAREPRTYQLLDKLISAASAPFRSRRIHLGMDEAQGIGTGRFMSRFGYVPPFDILQEHLAAVRRICRRRGLQPMIWSDMFFRLGSKTHDYYDRDLKIPARVARHMPRDVRLVYWDYYHLDQGFYEEWLDRHRALGSEPIMAGGVWTWNRFWTTLPFTFRAIDACMGACRARNVREVFMTLWGDGNAECDIYSALPGLQYFAEKAYSPTGQVDAALLRARFRGIGEADFDDYVRASELDAVPGLNKPDCSYANTSKILLWQDPLLAVMEPHLKGLELSEHYRVLAGDLFAASGKGGASRRLRFPAQLAMLLADKAHLHRRVASAYQRRDRRRIKAIVQDELPRIIQQVRVLWKAHRRLWMEIHKPFGWESLERRYGGLLARLETTRQRLDDFAQGRTDRIPELDEKLIPFLDLPRGKLPLMHASRVATPSFLK